MQGLFQGRLSYRPFRRATLFVLALNANILLALSLLFQTPTAAISLLVPLTAAMIICGLTFFYVELAVRRFHDIGRPGVWALALFLPPVSLYFIAVLCFRQGEEGENDFGRAPLDDGTAYVTPTVIALIALPIFSFLKYSNLSYRPSKSFAPTYTVTEISLQDRLRREPCHGQSAYDLSQSYLRSKHYQPAIDLEKDFHARCPRKVVQLQWFAFEAAKELQDFALAESIVATLIAQNPKDADYFIWRGRMFEDRGEAAKAVPDYEEGIRLKPKLQSIPLNLVDIYRHLGKPCQALETHVRYSKVYPEIMQNEDMKAFRQTLEKECKAASIL